MTLCALLSSVFVMNSSGRLDDDVFSALAPICRLDANAEERGGEPCRPELLWLLRDLPPEELVESADDHLESALYSTAAGRDATSRQPAREVRQGLLKFFRHRGCVALPPPVPGAQLHQLDQLPFSALSDEFRGGLERLRSHLVAGCLANPKAVGGQPLGCLSFVALLRQLVAAVNDDRILSMKGAWETVQHTVCGTLADELRAQAAERLHALAAGQPVPGGARLPLTDEALRGVLRDQRHSLKAQWDERAVGEECVRREYWQELKETLAREETLVRVRNARLADQQLMDALRSWQESGSTPTATPTPSPSPTSAGSWGPPWTGCPRCPWRAPGVPPCRRPRGGCRRRMARWWQRRRGSGACSATRLPSGSVPRSRRAPPAPSWTRCGRSSPRPAPASTRRSRRPSA
ncbi:unnamed protein product [Prorocentrum cordatum]|uniref:Guanylate-binding protein N-terminal domain-containing protein n=1 Tax=Prorocentrum cordatum TaxID=2364126 RepID=A0ABN9WV93_9DINO|nr:unnamed protein product [Polarella glacialis]